MIIEATIKPGSSQEKIVKNSDESYTIFLHASAHNGEANQALIKLLSKHFETGKTNIKILSGQKSRQKRIEINYPKNSVIISS